MMGDTPIMINKMKPEVVHKEAYDRAPQWLYIPRMYHEIYAKQAVNSLISVLGSPLHTEFVDTHNRPSCLRVCIQADDNFNYTRSLPYIVETDWDLQRIPSNLLHLQAPPHCNKCV